VTGKAIETPSKEIKQNLNYYTVQQKIATPYYRKQEKAKFYDYMTIQKRDYNKSYQKPSAPYKRPYQRNLNYNIVGVPYKKPYQQPKTPYKAPYSPRAPYKQPPYVPPTYIVPKRPQPSKI